jgi:hypothetical protein
MMMLAMMTVMCCGGYAKSIERGVVVQRDQEDKVAKNVLSWGRRWISISLLDMMIDEGRERGGGEQDMKARETTLRQTARTLVASVW